MVNYKGTNNVKKLLLISDTHFSKNNELLFGYIDVEKILLHY